MKIKSILLPLVAIALIPAFAQAKPNGEKAGKGERAGPAQMFEKLDVDQSGGVSADEAKGLLARNFDRIDTDGSGQITQDELAAAGDKMREQKKNRGAERFEKMDTDGSSSISKDEAKGRMLDNFEQLDQDDNGEVTIAELIDAKEQRQGNRQGGKGAKGEGKGRKI
jgi:Ca2+-binding EF-hand superfamily protein